LPKGAEVKIIPGELVRAEIVSPKPALDRWRRGEILIAAPNIIMLEEMSLGDGFESRILELTASYERGKLHRVYFTPGILLAPLETPTQPPATHTNTYIVGHERLYVVDPAPYDAAEQEKLWELLDEMHGEGRTLAGVLLTHAHPDHVGAVAECKNRYGLPVYAHRDAGRSLSQAEIDDELGDGQVLELGQSPDGKAGWSLQAYHTPGHAPGHLAFKENRYQALIVGDLISTLSSILIDPSDGHLGTYLESLKSMEPVADGTVYPSHGPAARDGRKAIQHQIRHRQEREEQILEALTSSPQTIEELVVKVYTDVDESMHGLARRSLMSGLIKLQEVDKVLQANDRYRLTSK
jgi:glyoxylase-like metal-dependent hydrolase (beta-lactamase superfamily II)